jgi:hypothetical protein
MKNKLIPLTAIIVAPVVIFSIINFRNNKSVESVAEPNRSDPLCLPMQVLLSELQTQFNESVIFKGYDPQSQLWQILTFDSSEESWTWISLDEQGIACVEQIGNRGSVSQVPLRDRSI